MKRRLGILVMVAAMLGLAQPVWGEFYVIGGSGSGVGTAIASLPYTISQPGFYYLRGNLSTTGSGNAITVDSDDVTLDLMGFCLAGPSASSGIGININNVKSVEVRNGSVRSFSKGINDAHGTTSYRNRRFTNLKVRGCGTGIYITTDGAIVTGCEATDNQTGFYIECFASIVDKNTATYNTDYGFWVGQSPGQFRGIVTNNAAWHNGTGFALSGQPDTLVDRNASHNNTTNWSGLTGCTVGLNTP